MKLHLGATIAAFTAFAAAGSAEAVVIYQTGFEPPTYTTTLLAGQDGWAVFGSAAVYPQSSLVKSGVQAVLVDQSMGSGQSGPYRSSPTSASKVSLSADIYISSASAQRAWQFSAIGPGLVGFSGGIDINPNGDILAISGAFPVIGSFSHDTWHNVDIRLDYVAQTYSLRLDNVTLASGLTFCGSNSGCTGAFLPSYDSLIFDTFGSFGTDRGYIDNVLVQTFTNGVPEPASWALMIAGFGMVGSQLRRRRIATA